MNRCSRCKKLKNDDDFFVYKHSKSRLDYWCKECNYKYRKEYRKYLKDILNTLKINGCAICGYDKCSDALDFHHTNPDNKIFQISVRSLEKPIEEIVNELNKCILLCANCHREIHLCTTL